MQTDNYVDFLLPIDIRAGVFMSVPDNIKAKSVPTRTLCNCSLVSNLSLWYLYLLSDLHWHSRRLVQQTEKTSLPKCIYCFQLFHFPFFKKKKCSEVIFPPFQLKVARSRQPSVVSSCLKIKIRHIPSPSTFYTDIPLIKKNKQTRV